MKRLLLLRHAKSSWDDPSLPDHDRPLAPRGRRAVQRIAEHLRSEGVRPDLVLCSSSRRTRETLQGLELAFDRTEVRLEHGLYAASDLALLARVRKVPEHIGSLALIGHNPGLQDLALELGGGRELARLRDKFPTGALATFEFDGLWRELGPGRARLVAFVVPKDLRGPKAGGS
jgi:phosphohistidine phosphatase